MTERQFRINGRDYAVQETVLDRLIGYVDPERAQRRLRARLQLAIAGGYTGARRDRRATSSWVTRSTDADTVVLADLATLRDRSRDLVRNYALACGAINTPVTNVVGTGLKPHASIDREALNLTDEQADTWEREAEREFRLWADSQDCDISRTLNFAGIQELVFRSCLESGDVFVSLPQKPRPGSPFKTRLQVIEGDRVCNADNKADTETLVAGVEKDADGAPVAYHVMKQHPGNLLRGAKRDWERLPAFGDKTGRRTVIHLYRMLRPGQTRGVPYLAPVIETLKQLSRYTEAEIMAAVVSGMLTVFVTSDSGQGALTGMGAAGQVGTQATTAASTGLELGNGAVLGLLPGEKIETVDPNRPNTAYDPFMLSLLRWVGVALELPFEILVKHFTASYSAARAALLEAWRFFSNRRAWLASCFCQVCWETIITESIAAGRLSAPGFFADARIRKAWLGCEWTGDSPGQINPKDEIEAAALRMKEGVTTLAEETAALTGGDWERKHPQQVKERRMRKEGGLLDEPKAAPAAPHAQGNDPDKPEAPDKLDTEELDETD